MIQFYLTLQPKRDKIVVRILHLANHCNRANGHVHVSVDMACTQVKRNHIVAYACSGGDYVDLLQQNGVRVFFMPEPHRNFRHFFSALNSFRSIRKEFKPDVVHIHMAAQNVVVQPFRLLGLRTVTTIHNEFDRSAYLMRFASRIVVVSKHGADAMHCRGFPRSKIRVVVNGPINSPRLPLVFEKTALHHPALVTVCGMHRRKGIADLLQAFKLILPDHPGAHLYLIGEGPSRQEYETLAADLGLGAHAVFPGPLIDPRPYLHAADIFILASHSDPGPLVIAEARHAGCAVIATNVDGIPEMLNDGSAGILVPPRQPAALARALDHLLTDPAEAKKYAALAQKNVEQFTIERVCLDMERVYAENSGPQAP